MVGILYVALFLHMAERERGGGVWGGGVGEVATTMPVEQIALYRPFSPSVIRWRTDPLLLCVFHGGGGGGACI
jgi:hypothetical protein